MTDSSNIQYAGMPMEPTDQLSSQHAQSRTARVAILAYAALSYAVFFASFLYAIGFIGGFGVPTLLDGLPEMPWQQGIKIDLALLAAFALQHSVMARPVFKRWITRFIPRAAERSTYVLMSSLALVAMFIWWQPLGGSVWQLESSLAQTLLYTGYGAGWALVLYSTFLINHFDLFGLRQAWLAYIEKPYTELTFVTPWLYRIIRHPLYLGWLMVVWITPDMTASHLFFAAGVSAYIFIGVRLEERDLVVAHPDYQAYQQSVPMIIPNINR